MVECSALVTRCGHGGSCVSLGSGRVQGEPYDEGAADQFALEKFVIFTRLCQYLGAKTVSALAVENAETGEKVSLSGQAGRGPITVDGGGTLSTLERFARQLRWNDVYAGGPANLSAAAHLLKEHAVDSDAVLRSLVESRRYDANPHRERELVVDLSSESSRTLDVALSLNIPTILKSQGKFGRSVSKQASYNVTYKVVFP
jgi:hypothetical protein